MLRSTPRRTATGSSGPDTSRPPSAGTSSPGATVFAYPTRYEGFGLPPLEAMAAGVPVLAARAGSLPEVLGPAAALVDPFDDDDIATTLSRLLDEPETRAALVKLGRDQVARYTWGASAEQFAQLYRSVA